MPGPVIDIDADIPRGGAPRSRGRFGCGTLLLGIFLVLFLGRTIGSTVVDYQWWKEIGQLHTWWQQLYVHTAPVLYITLFGYVVLWLVHARALKAAGTSIAQNPVYARIVSVALLPFSWVLASLPFSSWEIATWIGSRGMAPASAWRDPIFGNPVEFYFFDLPVYLSVASYLFLLLLICAAGYFLVSRLWQFRHQFGGGQFVLEWSDLLSGDASGARILAAGAILAYAARQWLSRYETLYDDHPFLTGADYVAVNLSIPMAGIWAVLLVIAALLVAVGRARLAAGFLLFLPIKALLPVAVGSIHVRPNENTLQRPFIEHHIAATREAFGLTARYKELSVKSVPSGRINVAANQTALEAVRLWDWDAFHDTVTQIQPLRPYVYLDTDIDRYRIGGKLRQVLLTPRELEINQLGAARDRWPNRHVIYTHGYGVVAADANSITPNGLPRLFIQDAPPKVTADGMKLTRPEIYYGEVAHEPIFVRTSQPEFNYPSGSDNVHNKYDGTGGFPISSLPMRVAAALTYGDWNILLTSYLQAESRMMIRRQVADRVEALAPFLHWDADPYLVLRSDGRLTWVLDGYTTSTRHPYSERMRTRQGSLNYIRNSVKATVDAYTGEVRLYAFDEADPLLRAYRNLFSGLFQAAETMPGDLREHLRYPERIFQIQAEVLLTFHMNDPDSFYNKVDVWDVARRSSPGNASGRVALEPNYVVATLPREAGGTGSPEFLLMLPFTPRGKDNLIGMLIARCDGEAMGELALLELPKEELFYGPLQVESRINQDQNISKDLTLWNSQGSQVLRGQMVVLPLDDTFLYIQPIYLQSEQARMPQMKKVILAYGNEMIYADTYEQALAQLAGGQMPARETPASTSTAAPPRDEPAAGPGQRLESVRKWMDRYRNAARQGQWAEAGKALDGLEAELKRP